MTCGKLLNLPLQPKPSGEPNVHPDSQKNNSVLPMRTNRRRTSSPACCERSLHAEGACRPSRGPPPASRRPSHRCLQGRPDAPKRQEERVARPIRSKLRRQSTESAQDNRVRQANVDLAACGTCRTIRSMLTRAPSPPPEPLHAHCESIPISSLHNTCGRHASSRALHRSAARAAKPL